MIFEAACSILLADFFTGIGHWFEDAYCTKDMEGGPIKKLIGSEVCNPNLLHHEKPTEFIKNSLWEMNYVSMAVAIIPATLFIVFGYYILGAAALLAGLGNQVHAWSHSKPNYRFRFVNKTIMLLQRCCIIQTPAQHAVHHKPPFDKSYCTITNVCNPILDDLKFWRWVEYLVFKLFGLKSNYAK